MSVERILIAVFGREMVKMISGDGALDALSPVMWSTMRVTLLLCLVVGLVLLFTVPERLSPGSYVFITLCSV